MGKIQSLGLAFILALTGVMVNSTNSASGATAKYKVTPIYVDTLVGPNNDQKCRISADLYIPNHASSNTKVPAILTTNGFGGEKSDNNVSSVGKGFASSGYLVLGYSGLGFGTTGCKVMMDDPVYDGKAGKQMVDVLAGKKPYFIEGDASKTPHTLNLVAQEAPGDPRVGMIGGSYGGQIQYAVAMQDRRVDALIPIITWNNLAYALAPNNTSITPGNVNFKTPGVAKRLWIDIFFSAGIFSGVQNVMVAKDYDTMLGCPNFKAEACPIILQANVLGYPSADMLSLGKQVSVATYADKIKVPTLIVQGQKDSLFNLQEAVTTYRQLKAVGTTTKMIWQSWGHSGSKPAPGELDFAAPSLRDSYLGNRFLNWMNHYVRGDQKASTGPEFEYYQPWVKHTPDAAGAKLAYARFAKFSTPYTHHLYFSGDKQLVSNREEITTGKASYENIGGLATSYSETSGLEGMLLNNPISDTVGTFVNYTSAPLAKRAIIVGSPRVKLHLKAPLATQTQKLGTAGQLILFTKIYDVAPNGTQTLQNRLISPARVADVTKPVTVVLPAVVQKIPAGHRIRVVVSGGDFAYLSNKLPQPVGVTTSVTAPSQLSLPLRSRLVFR